MKKLILLVILSLATTAGIGLKRGWFQLTSTGDDKSSNVSVTVDKSKIHDDKQKVIEKTHDLEDKAADLAKKHGAYPQPTQRRRTLLQCAGTACSALRVFAVPSLFSYS